MYKLLFLSVCLIDALPVQPHLGLTIQDVRSHFSRAIWKNLLTGISKKLKYRAHTSCCHVSFCSTHTRRELKSWTMAVKSLWNQDVQTPAALQIPTNQLLGNSQLLQLAPIMSRPTWPLDERVFVHVCLCVCVYLKQGDSYLYVLWNRPHHHSSIGVLNARLPAMRLGTKKNYIR